MQAAVMNYKFKGQVKKLVKNAYAQHECPHGKFIRKYYADYKELTKAIQTAAHKQLTAQEFREWNNTITIQTFIKRMWKNTRQWKRQQWKRQQAAQQAATT